MIFCLLGEACGEKSWFFVCWESGCVQCVLRAEKVLPTIFAVRLGGVLNIVM